MSLKSNHNVKDVDFLINTIQSILDCISGVEKVYLKLFEPQFKVLLLKYESEDDIPYYSYLEKIVNDFDSKSNNAFRKLSSDEKINIFEIVDYSSIIKLLCDSSNDDERVVGNLIACMDNMISNIIKANDIYFNSLIVNLEDFLSRYKNESDVKGYNALSIMIDCLCDRTKNILREKNMGIMKA